MFILYSSLIQMDVLNNVAKKIAYNIMLYKWNKSCVSIYIKFMHLVYNPSPYTDIATHVHSIHQTILGKQRVQLISLQSVNSY